MNIEKSKDWCCCQQSSLTQEQIQENTSRNYLNRKDYNQYNNHSTNYTPQHTSFKHVFNFRQNSCRLVSHQKTNINYHQAPSAKHNILTLSKSHPKGNIQDFTKVTFIKIEACSNSINFKAKPICINRLKSPRNISYFCEQVHTSAARHQSPRVKFTLGSPTVSKMQGKRIKTAEEQTEYSSKHSQIYFKNTSQSYDNASNFCKNSLGLPQKPVSFQQQPQSDKFHTFVQFPSCRQVSAREEVDHQLSNQFFQNTRTMQTIVTSNGRKSREPSSPCNFNPINRDITHDTPVNSQKTSAFPSINDITHKSQLQSLYQTPKSNLNSETPQYSQINLCPTLFQKKPFETKIQSNMFYSKQTFREKALSPKISVLHIQQKDNSQEEELRDKIDNNYLQSQYLSKNNSPLISINESLKNVTEDRRSAVNFQFSPIHSRQGSKSGQNSHFKKTLSQLKRTKTVESLQSSASEHSYLDMKFILKNRSRRGVSKLV